LNEINEPLTVKEFVSNSSNLTFLTERAIVITEQDQHMTNLIARFLEEIDEYDVSLDAYTEELGSATDLVKLKTVMAKIRSELHVEEVQAAKNTSETETIIDKEAEKNAREEARDLAAAIRAAQKAQAATERENKKTDTEE
jgi:D-ribose pyranose/furanose isomerase RbsD